MAHPINILERYWKFTDFRPLQEDIINAVINNEDTFALLPTGGGKSVCFQIPALAKEGICIVISPLVALMKDQVNALLNKGIKAIALTSGIPNKEIDTLLDNCIYGNYKFLYLSPERLQQELVQDRIRQMNVNLIAVDEAHCISQWGNDFRPAYKNINILRQLHPTVNVIALTASATPEVVEDIITELDFISPKVFKQSFYRPNIAYMVFEEEDKYFRLEAILLKNKQPSIIYVRNRRLTLEITQYLESKNISSTYYHGGLNNTIKDQHLNDWLSSKKQVMVATNAFGMGIDKSDVKTVIHINLPDSIESYFQEAGRAGRDEAKAYAVILKNKNDNTALNNQFLKVLPTVDFVKIVYRKLCSYFQISYGEGAYQTFDFNFNEFCKTYKFNTVTTYNALNILDNTSIITLSKQFNKRIEVQFLISSHALFKYLDAHKDFEIIIKSILRTYGGIFEHSTKINSSLISDKAGIKEIRLVYVLEQLAKDEVITLLINKTDAQITFIEPREDEKTINRIASIIKQQNTLKQKQVQAVLDYINNDQLCKSIQLLTYFGEKDVQPCGICSVCISAKAKPKTDFKTVKNKIIECLEFGDKNSKTLFKTLPFTEEDINNTLKKLLENDIVELTKTNSYKLKHI
ncbi:RecQ family ATP-dependent DNA helicase [Olleya sp. UBA1516]|uniref:RecQ family ATP-dependent DNA helicase n=1 Tax=Olleya sp. UBA1516 TaxID=1947013 RepID=UPI0025DE150A|nr:RecQ family ATP-dependent DNA helicase [Olleya sp. UBA1516]|tara:strand:- start:1577 stop:3478 length:1902 start_codon:yes stop_codon:yes gene_type:complete